MEKKIQDYLHLYLGCQISGYQKTKLVGFVYRDGERWPLVQDFKPSGEPLGRSYSLAYETAKPILRPLSSMTEEEAIECAKLSEWEPHFRSPKVERTKYNDLVVTWDGSNEGGEEQNITGGMFYCSDQFQWLLSKHFDLFNLIPDGLALDATKINEPVK